MRQAGKGLVRWVLAVGLLLWGTAMAPAWAQQQGRRVALLIANAAYEKDRLRYPAQDAAVMKAALLKIGFAEKDVVVVNDADLKTMKRAVQELGRRAQGAEVALFYYSGHGAQAASGVGAQAASIQNWLIPIGANLQAEADYEIEALSAQAPLTQINAALPKVGIVILDACRDNPLAVNKSGLKGLGLMDPGDQTLVAFATAPNRTAADNGLYARTLAAELQKPGQELVEAFRNTIREVRRASGGKQVPRISDLSLGEKIYLAGAGSLEEQAWKYTRERDTAAAYEAFLVEYGSGQYAPQARIRLAAARLGSGAQGERACVNGVCIELVAVPGGEFLMGSPPSEQERDSAEGPQHRVSVRPFLLGRFEVTQGQWKAVMGSNPSRFSGWFSGCGDDCPVESVSWHDAQEFVKKLSAATGRQYRLPSEAEWEYAARAGTTGPFSTGERIEAPQANFVANYTYNGSAKGRYLEKTVRAGSYAANGFGLHDMHGNVEEWVQDIWHDSYEGAPTDESAWETGGDGAWRVLRGGSWNSFPHYLRSANRYRDAPVFRNDHTGFRIARTY